MGGPDDVRTTQSRVERDLRALVEWAAAVRFADIPAPVVRKAALIVADNLSAMVAARDEPEVSRGHDRLLRDGGRPEATVFRGGRARTDRISAALANSIAGCWCELDEGYRLASCHAGLYTLPALLAEAEAAGLSVAQALRAAVASYEVVARCARCWTIPPLTVHPHPAWAAIGGAAAVCAARGHGPDLFFNAVTAAATLVSIGDFQHAIDGSLVRNVWAAIGTANGARAADWVECGIGGAPRGPYSVYTERLGIPPEPDQLTAKLGTEWAITRAFHKIHACCLSTHSAAEAALAARAAMSPARTPRQIEHMLLETPRPSMSNPRPATTLAARFAFEHVLATAQVHGHAGPEAFSSRTLDDPEIARLRERVELRQFTPELAPPNDRPARLTIRFDDGTTLVKEVLSAQGGPDRPFDEAVILSKVERLTAGVYSRFGGVMRDIMAQAPARLEQSWADVVGEFAGS